MSVDPCSVVKANLAATEEALLDCTDAAEDVRELLRAQIIGWRALPFRRSWKWIKQQQTWEAFVRLGGS